MPHPTRNPTPTPSRTLLPVEQARRVPLRLGPSQVHPLQHLCPVLRIRAAGASLH